MARPAVGSAPERRSGRGTSSRPATASWTRTATGPPRGPSGTFNPGQTNTTTPNGSYSWGGVYARDWRVDEHSYDYAVFFVDDSQAFYDLGWMGASTRAGSLPLATLDLATYAGLRPSTKSSMFSAEEKGFEPLVPLRALRFSKSPSSSARSGQTAENPDPWPLLSAGSSGQAAGSGPPSTPPPVPAQLELDFSPRPPEAPLPSRRPGLARARRRAGEADQLVEDEQLVAGDERRGGR